MWELGSLADASPDAAEDVALLEVLSEVSGNLFRGWGHSGWVEGAFRELRLREDKDTANKDLSTCRQWDMLHSRDLLPIGDRDEVTIDI